MLICLNLNANAKTAQKKWSYFKNFLDEKKIRYELVETRNLEELQESLDKLNHRFEYLIAAGGDGTVNGLISFVLSHQLPHRIGAIGLGSSNDFHKPMKKNLLYKGIPFLLPGFFSSELWDAGVASFKQGPSDLRKYFSINSSIGLTADGNSFFNSKDKALNFLKRQNVELGNIYTMIHLLKNYSPKEFHLVFEDQLRGENVDKKFILSNLGILKKTNVSGGMRYDTFVSKDDGLFDIVGCEDMDRFELLKVITNLYRGKFLNANKTFYHQTKSIKIKSFSPFNFETDGEVYETSEVEISVLPKKLRVC